MRDLFGVVEGSRRRGAEAHQNPTTLRAGRSFRTESAANAITARTSSAVRVG